MTGGDWKRVGHLASIARYPLKGVAGEVIETARVGWHGIAHDRQFGLLRTTDLTGFPWASPRNFPQLLTWAARFGPEHDLLLQKDGDELQIKVADSSSRLAFAASATAALGEPVFLVNIWSGAFDSMPISVISSDTVDNCGELVGSKLDPRRFRSNILIDTETARPWPERQWLGRELRLGEPSGSVTLRVDRHTTRCEVVNYDVDTGDYREDLFGAIRQANRNRAGVYATPSRVGLIETGADVFIR